MSYTFSEIFLSVIASFVLGVLISPIISVLTFCFKSAFFVCFSVTLYGVMYMLLSYIFLDGALRLYTLVISLLGFYLSKRLVLDKMLRFMKKMVKKLAHIPLFGRRKHPHTLDKLK